MNTHIALYISFFAFVLLFFCLRFSCKIFDIIYLHFANKCFTESNSSDVANEQISSDNTNTLNVTSSEIDNNERRRRYEENLRIRALSSDNSGTLDFTQIGFHSLRVTLPPETDCATRRNTTDVQISIINSGVEVNSRSPPTYEDVLNDRDGLPSYASLMKESQII